MVSKNYNKIFKLKLKNVKGPMSQHPKFKEILESLEQEDIYEIKSLMDKLYN